MSGGIIDVDIFMRSVEEWMHNISVNSVIILIMMCFMILGAIDRLRGNKLGYGEQFEEGIRSMGTLALAMAGVIAATPILSIILSPIILPVNRMLGADASMFAGTILACDMGAYSLAMETAENSAVGIYSGFILGSMLGTTIVFTIPIALTIVNEHDRLYLGTGVLCGLITIPVGCIVGGIAMQGTSYYIGIKTILINTIPVILVALLIVAGLWVIPNKMIKGFTVLGNLITKLVTIFFVIAVFEYETLIKFPLFYLMVEPNTEGIVPLESGLLTCGQIAIVLIGAFPMVKWLEKALQRPLQKLGKRIGMNANGVSGLLASMANNIAMFKKIEQMTSKEKLINIAFAVSASFVFGDHLGFTAGVNSEMVFPVVIGKLTAGVTALILANILSPILLAKIERNAAIDK